MNLIKLEIVTNFEVVASESHPYSNHDMPQYHMELCVTLFSKFAPKGHNSVISEDLKSKTLSWKEADKMHSFKDC